MENLEAKLYDAWKAVVFSGKLLNQFEAYQDDLSGRWLQGEKIVYGIKYIDEQIKFYADHVDKNFTATDFLEERQVEATEFICQFNCYRNLRPGRTRRNPGRQPILPKAPSQCGFYCQDAQNPISLLSRPPLLNLDLKNFLWNAYYNASPIEKEGHFLFVPTTATDNISRTLDLPHYLQVLSLEFLEDIILLFKELSNTILFYNSLNAGASVNHFHFQGICHRHSLALEKATLVPHQDYYLLDNYPAQALAFPVETDARVIYSRIQELHRESIPYNLIFLKEHIFVFPRDVNHEVVVEFPQDRLASPAMCGKIIISDYETYLNTDRDALLSAFIKMMRPVFSHNS